MTIEACIAAACRLECSARKPGNVTPEHDFDDLTYADFVASAPVTARCISQAGALGVGPAIELAAAELRHTVGRNTHLGILLLTAPLAAAAHGGSLAMVLESLSVEDARAVYRAIRTLEPGGMGEVDDQDIANEPTEPLLECMRLAAHRDSIAAQYVTGFATVLRYSREIIVENETVTEPQIIRLHLKLMAELPDSLIARKCGEAVAAESSRRAALALTQGCSPEAISHLDAWLRADGHRRNPGTTADMVAAVLFVALHNANCPDRPLV